MKAVQTAHKTRRGNPDKIKPYKWKPGFCPNPSGRPKKKPVTEALEHLYGGLIYPVAALPEELRVRLGIEVKKKYTWADVAARFLHFGIMTGKGGIASCFAVMADRLEGKVVQGVEVSGCEESPIAVNLKVLSDKDLNALEALLDKAGRGEAKR
jgi:hypothetical protein